MASLPFQLPPDVERELRGRDWQRVDVGMSRANVFRFEGGLYLKTVLRDARDSCFGNLEGERSRLAWLSGKLPVPAVIAFARDEARDYLVISEIPGRHAAAETPTVAAMPAIIERLAAACRSFHAVPTLGCPFVERADTLLGQAQSRLDAGLVDSGDFDAERQGRDPAELFRELRAMRPRSEDLVIAHGDFCLPNIILQGDEVAGFVDLGRAGVADRWRDLALCARSIGDEWGIAWSASFIESYGRPSRDEARAFYLLLDEFF